MAADPTDHDQPAVTSTSPADAGNGADPQHVDVDVDVDVDDHDAAAAAAAAEEDDDEADEEPKLKYSRLTSSLGPVYRNGDATSSFLVAGDKMVCLN